MCGIVGVFSMGRVDPSPVPAMARALSHRGPDEHTVRRYGGQAPYAALGIERLAIIDIANGTQPMADPSGRWRVALNGEIYNHQQLRTTLEANGVQFKTQSDTEVVAALIASNGMERALSMCHGMFALAVLDTQDRRLFLVRDRMGVKPLHWTELPDGTVAFASEIKGLMQHPQVQPTVDPISVQRFLLFEYIPTPHTIWAGIQKVEPGTWIQFDGAGTSVHRWWTAPQGLAGRPGNFERWAKSLHGALQIAVGQRAEADVEIGFLLSGGLDSASVAALAARRTQQPIQTFTLAVSGDGFDESPAAAATAAQLGAIHRTATLGPGDMAPILDAIVAHMDEPLADSSLITTWRLMQMVSEHGIKCVLSGDGADEVFGGYPTYLAHRLAGPASPAKSILSRAVGRLPVRSNGVTSDYMARRFVHGLGLDWQRRHQVWMGAWLPEELQVSESVWEQTDRVAKTAGNDPVARAMYLDQRMYLSDGVLVKVDRAAGAHGIEVRSPFLDHSIVELGASMGSGHHTRAGATKRVLRQAMEGVLTEATRTAAKKGFGAPVGPWLRNEATHLLDDLTDATADWIPPKLLKRCIQEHRAGTADHRRRLWSALILARWRTGPHGCG
jgi:asparagine synthase (glutamine-hydrolysing)